ncbi:endonuclease MutS2 isoform X4 [Zingiber officinale]|uniref:endonuclease MutS2 isoform X4 n=1 Tax=Zingiber officinale TaxID=94328 RepID=UPI001C4C85CB|nr:endonuclease MutS2 isoform X4 [Zingiber officinale]
MLVAQRSLALSPIPTLSNPSASPSAAARRFARLLPGALPGPLLLGPGDRRPGPSELTDTLKILEWDKLCGAVAAFAGTALGRDATKAQLSHVDVSFEESNKLLKETAAAVELINYGAGGFDFAGVDTVLVKSAITRVSRGSPLNGSEAMAVVGLIKYADALQVTLKTAVKEDSEWYSRFMPITPMLMDVAISQSFVKSAQLVIDEDGSVKDSASSELRRSRDQVRSLERKVYQLVDKLIRQGKSETSTSEMCIVNGRCCIRVMGDRSTTLGGLLLSSDSSSGSMLEPIAAIPLNDELQQARALVVKAEEDVLSRLTDKMLEEIDDIQYLLQTIISLDVEIRRNSHGGGEEEGRARLASMKLRVSELEENRPIPVDFMISGNTGVLVITGPNTGGKTISLKTVGLSSLMAKTGVYVIASEPVKIPWFDGIFADIGDEQSLTQSLSTFSGHLRQIGAIRSRSTNKSLVLLDEVGAGTNPLEGAALGMSILESFAEAGSFLTIATTHHGELKTLKYSSSAAFENACVEFDELSLKPTYKILWGVPGRSNAINIAERLGLANVIVDGARKLLGTASAEINEVIVDMERFKQSFQQDLQDAERYLMLSKELRGSLLLAKKKIADHGVKLKRRKAKAIADSAAVARSLLRHKLHQFRESTEMKSKSENIVIPNSHSMENLEHPKSNTSSGWSISSQTTNPMNAKECYVPAVGDTVNIPSLGKDAVVLKVEESKGEILVQASNMKLRLKLTDIKS